jgi:hypothetical protein
MVKEKNLKTQRPLRTSAEIAEEYLPAENTLSKIKRKGLFSAPSAALLHALCVLRFSASD